MAEVITLPGSRVPISLGAMKAPTVGLPKIADVSEHNYCTSCGTCEQICPVYAPVVRRTPVDVSKDKRTYRKVEIKTEVLFQGINPYQQEINPCVNCYACERVCPVLDGFEEDELKGIRAMRAARSTELKGQDGAAVSQIIKSLLEQGEIDVALGVERDEQWDTKTAIMTKPEDVPKTAGTKYTYEPVVAYLRQIIRSPDYQRIAVVGVPCQVHGLRLLQENLTDKIKLIIGLICMESFSYEIMSKEMVPGLGLNIRDATKMNFHKGKFSIETPKEKKEVPIKDVAPLARTACHHCIDYTSCYSDITVGSVGSEDGWSTIFVRTEAGEKYLNKVKGLEFSDKPVEMKIIKKLTAQKHENNAWDWKAFMKDVWTRDSPPREWGLERLKKRGII